MLVLSTAHITLEDSKILEAKKFCYCDAAPFGWMISGLNANIVANLQELADHATKAGLSMAFAHVCKKALALKCERLLLDADGPIDPTLPTFDW